MRRIEIDIIKGRITEDEAYAMTEQERREWEMQFVGIGARMLSYEPLSLVQAAQALYNDSPVRGLGFLNAKGLLTDEEMQVEIDGHREQNGRVRFDYLYGRVMKVIFYPSSNEVDVLLYERDNGPGSAQRALDKTLDELTRG